MQKTTGVPRLERATLACCLALLIHAPLHARATDDWARVQQTPIHTDVVVRMKSGRTWEGTIKQVAPDSLTLTIHEPGQYVIDRELPRVDINRVRKQGPGKGAGILIGTGVGIGIGAGIGAVVDSQMKNSEDPGLTTLVGGILGALFGSLFGRFLSIPGRTIYQAH